MRRRNKRTGPGGLFCAGYVAAIVLCMSASVTGQPSGDCCYDHPYPGCQDPPCEFEICMIFPECCDIEWLPHCTDAAHMNPACNCGGSEPEPCCFGDGHCEMLTPDDCVIMEGISYPGGQCHGTEEACCTPDGLCLMADPYCCEVDHLGVPVFGAQCAFFTEACCDSFPPEGCQDTDPVCCEVSSGWLPGEAMCLGDNNGTGVDDACETIEPEACCFPDGSCLDGLLPDDCTHQGGTPQGSGSVCTGTTEACCIDDGTGVGMFCVDADPLCCDELGGVAQGPGSVCSTQTIACCLPDGSCADVDPLCCDELGGVPSAHDLFCLGDLNTNGTDDACEDLPRPSLDAGVNIDVHMDIQGVVATGFHVEGRIESGVPGGNWGDPPILIDHVDGLFPDFTYSVVPDPADPNQNWWLFRADWSGYDYTYCQILHLGLLFDVQCHNVVIDLSGTWTLDGVPIGVGQNQGFWPVLGFNVTTTEGPSGPGAQFIRIQNGNLDAVQDPGEITVAVLQMDVMPFASEAELESWLGPEPFRELREGGLQESLPWIPVEPISESEPVLLGDEYWVESFFDVFFDASGTYRPVTPFDLPPGGFLLARERIWFSNNDGLGEERWIWEMHEGHQSDLGDAPDSTNSWGMPMSSYPANVQASFPTVYMAGSPPYGPIHWLPQMVAFLGDNVSTEFEADLLPDQDGVPNIDPPSNAQDQDGFDDGVNIPLTLPHCDPTTTFDYRVTAVVPTGDLYVNVFFDWDRNGDWDGLHDCGAGILADEWAVQNQLIGPLPTGVHTFTTPQFTPWHPTNPPEEIWMRITLSEKPYSPMAQPGSGGHGPPEGYDYGETEDYYFTPQGGGPEELEPKWVQLPHDGGQGFDVASNLWWRPGAPLKWEQEFEPSITGFHCHDGPVAGEGIICANDWICDGGLVTDFHWWGYNEPLFQGEQQWGFQISIHANDPASCLPDDLGPAPLPLQYMVPIGQVTMTDTGYISMQGTSIYLYEWDLPEPFDQIEGEHYWVDIMSVSVDPNNPYFWKWCQSLPAPVQCNSAYKQFPNPSLWQPFGPDDIELAFAVSSDAGAQPAEPNKVVADDFISDGRPIRALRWWGSYLDSIYEPDQATEPYVLDGWFLTFHHGDPAIANPGCPPDSISGDGPTALAVYFAPVYAVEAFPTGVQDCLDHNVFEYYVDLSRCCLVCSNPDPRDGDYPGQDGEFRERKAFHYWLSIQAVVGVTWLPPACSYGDLVLTGHLPSPNVDGGHFWGWHTSPHDLMAHRPIWGACTGQITDFSTYPPDCWQYGGWDVPLWECPTAPPDQIEMAYELWAPQRMFSSVWSAIQHGTVGGLRVPVENLMLTLAPGYNIEPRQPGVGQLEFEMIEAMDPLTVIPGNVQVGCYNTPWVGTITTSLQAGPAGPNSMVVVNLAPSLPDQDCCHVSLNGMATASGTSVEGAAFVRPLSGDIDRNGVVSTADASAIKAHFGQPANSANFLFDYDANGVASTADFSAVKARFGHTAPACP